MDSSAGMSDRLIWRDGQWVPEDLPEITAEAPPEKMIFQGGRWVPEEIDFSAVEMVKNAPGSLSKMGSEFMDMVRSSPELIGLVADNPSILKEIPGQIWDDLKDSYGGIERFQRTLQEDPARVVSDLIGVSGAAGIPLKMAGKVAKPLGESLYTGAAKFSPTLPVKEKKELVRSAIDRGVSTTEAGVGKLSSRIDTLNNKMDDIIAGADPDDIIPIDRVLQPIKQVRSELGGMNNFDAARDLAVIDALEDGFRSHAANLGRDKFTVRELQQFKKKIYDTIKFDAKKQTGTMAEEKARKAAGRGARKEIVDAVPDAAEVNKELSELYKLQPHAERAASRISNLNPVSLTGMGMGGFGGLGFGMGGGLGGPETALTSLASAIAMSQIMGPRSLQGAGRGLAKWGQAAGQIPGMQSAAQTGFLMPGRVMDEDEED